jgi:hypothetical protein
MHIGAQPEIPAQNGVEIVERKAIHVIARAKREATADIVGVIEAVVAYPRLDFGQPETLAPDRHDPAQGGGNGERAPVVERVFQVIGRLEPSYGNGAGPGKLVLHGGEHRIRRLRTKPARRNQ